MIVIVKFDKYIFVGFDFNIFCFIVEYEYEI